MIPQNTYNYPHLAMENNPFKNFLDPHHHHNLIVCCKSHITLLQKITSSKTRRQLFELFCAQTHQQRQEHKTSLAEGINMITTHMRLPEVRRPVVLDVQEVQRHLRRTLQPIAMFIINTWSHHFFSARANNRMFLIPQQEVIRKKF